MGKPNKWTFKLQFVKNNMKIEVYRYTIYNGNLNEL